MDVWPLNLRHLASIAATARLGSLSAAAQAVHLTQPALTQGISKLEQQLGQPMFDRRPDGMAATEAARLLCPRIERALAHVGSSRVTMAQMRALIAVGDAGSYAAASQTTGLAQPSLHRAVADLSLALRRTLVERRGKGIALTEAGRRVLRQFRLARAELSAGLSELAAMQGRETGRITIGAMPLSRARILPLAVTAYLRRYPDAEISIVEGSYAELAEPLRDGDIDVLIGALRDNAPADGLRQSPLFVDHPVVLARAGHPLAGATPDVAALAAYPWAVAAPGTPLRAQWERMFEGAGIAPPRVPVECGSVITIREILRDSDFLTLLSPDQVAVELAAGWLVKLCDTPPSLVRTIGTTARENWFPTEMQRAFIDQLGQTAVN
jgi:LysR family transcriptional regulator, regulator for genes of the gallate degradation pathway